MTNDFQQFGNSGGANVVSQSAYLTLLAGALANGFQAGTAPSAQVNKVIRQSATIAAMVAQYVAAVSAQNVVDDGTMNTILANFSASVATGVYGVDSGTANTYVITPSPALVVLIDGLEVSFKTSNPNTGASTLNVGTFGAINLVNPDGSSLALSLIHI